MNSRLQRVLGLLYFTFSFFAYSYLNHAEASVRVVLNRLASVRLISADYAEAKATNGEKTFLFVGNSAGLNCYKQLRTAATVGDSAILQKDTVLMRAIRTGWYSQPHVILKCDVINPIERLSTIFVPGKSYESCKLEKITAWCDNLGGDFEEPLVYPLTSQGLAQLQIECRKRFDDSVSNNSDWSCGPGGMEDPDCIWNDPSSFYYPYYQEFIEAYRSDQPWSSFVYSLEMRKITQEVSAIGISNRALSLKFNEQQSNITLNGPVDLTDLSCERTLEMAEASDYFYIDTFDYTSKSSLREGSLNPDFAVIGAQSAGVLNTDQTLERFYFTPSDDFQASILNSGKRCMSDGIPWVVGVAKDITADVSIDGQEPNPDCDFITVLAPGTVLYDIAKKVLINNQKAIVDGTQSSQTEASRPKILDLSTPYFEVE